VTAAVDLAMLEWEEGARRLAALDLTARRRAVVETVAAELEAEIVRRIGQTFDLAHAADAHAAIEARATLGKTLLEPKMNAR